jgi:hypothetical protein
MATRLESGQIQLRSAGGVPMERVTPQQVDFVGPRAEAAAANTMANILDRMSESTFQKAAELREREGIRFAAENPPSVAQLKLAAGIDDVTGQPLQGGPMVSAIPGLGKISSDVSIYGRAVAKARTLQLASHFEIEGRAEAAKLLTEVQNGLITSKDVSAKLLTVTNGYATALAEVDGEASIKFRATMATHGNTVLNAAYEAESKRKKAQTIAKFDFDFDNSMQLLEAQISQGFFTDSNGQKRSIDDMAFIVNQNIATNSLLLGDAALQKEYSEKFRVALRTAKINAVTKFLLSDEYMADPDLTLKKIISGDLGKMSDVLKGLVVNDFDAVAKITANFITANNEREAIATRKKETAKLAGQAEAVDLLEQIFPLAKNNPARKPLIDKLLALPPGSTPIGTIKDLLEPDKPTGDGEGNSLTNYNALGLIYNGTIKTKEDLDKIPGLSIKQRTALLRVLNKDDKTNDSKLDSAINKLSDLPETSNGGYVLDPKSESFKKRQKLKLRAAEIENDAAQKGKPITAPEIIEQLEKEELDKKNRSDAKQAQDKLNNYARNPDGKAKPGREWITGPINKQSIEALRRQAGNDPVKLRQVRDMEALLKQAEGN